MKTPVQLNRESVAILAKLANLHLEEERMELICRQLSGWLNAANELSEKMRQSKYMGIMPVTVFHHPGYEGGEE